MDAIVNTALEEICSNGSSGLHISKLWQKLHSPISNLGLKLCPNVKKALWFNLIDIPNLKFEANNGAVYSCMDSCVRSIDESENLDLKIVAPEYMCDGFIGVYDVDASDAKLSMHERRVLRALATVSERLDLKIVAPEYMCDGFIGVYDVDASDAKLSMHERRVLRALATVRGKGIAQNELGKDFKIKGNDMFYIVRKLEKRGLIVRQPTILRIRDMAGEGKGPVSTNMLYLSRYAKNLGSQQRLEITKGVNSLEDSEITDGEGENSFALAEESLDVDLCINDFLPELEAVCDKLEKAEGKVLAMADIKPELGYQGRRGHRRWRYILKKLKEAQVVKEDDVIVDGKEVKCLHLLKGFSPKHFETMMKKAKRGHISDLLLELSFEHQIYEMVDAEGDRGLSFNEACKRLGLSNKQHYNRLFDIINRFGIHMEPELINKAKGYRLWTPGSHNPGASPITLNKPVVVPSEISGCTPLGTHTEFQENSALPRQDVDASVPVGNTEANSQNTSTGTLPKVSDGLVLDEKDESVPVCLSSSLDSTIKVSSTTADAELQIVSASSSYVAPTDALALAVPAPPRRRSYPRYPCLTLEATSAKREQWILQLLQEEKFLVKSDLYRRIQDLEKEKTTTTDRKTLDRCLYKLVQGGHCKIIVAYVPVLTNCNHSRRIQVVLHPSVSSVSAEEIHERFRSFETYVRTQSFYQLKKGEPIPEMNDLARTHQSIKLNQAERAEAMRTNGFVLAKMVRTKILHIYLWEYVNSLPDCEDVLSSFKPGHDLKNPHSTCKLIDLNAAIKAMTLELFLQVVGSTQKFEDTVDKCKNGVCLSDLPLLEYKRLMDIQATGRLSSLIDILRRLKLIRLVCGGHPENTADLPHTTLTHVLELKPYIEEPVCSAGSSHFFHSSDLRPQIRHDFVLSSKKAVEEYWNTLEYCYSASDRKAALHAFPGCAVNEVFLFKSWTSVRVMTADQRAELLKRVINDGPQRKLSFKECEEIAKDLNLTFEQVLRVYHDKRQRRLTRFDRVSDAGDRIQLHQGTPTLSPMKRKRPARRKSSKHAEAGTEPGQPQALSQIVNEEESSFPSTSYTHTCSLEGYHVQDDVISAEESEFPEDDGVGRAFLGKYGLSRAKPTRSGRFCWTDDVDRQLVIEYARHRAALGANFNRVDWGKLQNLPAPPGACRRRIASLRRSQEFRKSVMRLCNVLSKRYVDYLEKSKDKTLNHEGHIATDCYCFKQTSNFLSQEPWDNFDEANVKLALEDSLRCKKLSKSETSKAAQPFFDNCSDVNTDERHVSCGPQSILPVSCGEYVEDFPEKTEDSGTPISSNKIPKKYVNLIIGGIPINKRLYESAAVANAAELFKLIFLCSSKSPLVPTLLAETLRRYSEHDLFAAFNYLRDKKFLIGGHSNSPFVLSQTFLNGIEFSPFPSDTGKRAAKFASWLCEREKELIAEGVDLPADLQCGDVYHLFALLLSGELSITPCLPDEGVGEAEDSRTSKRKYDDSEFSDSDRYKKLKTSMGGDSETCTRRAKGFPGIRLCLRHATLSRIKTMDLFKDTDNCTRAPSVEEHQATDLGSVSFDSDDQVNELNDSGVPYTAVSPTESPWQAMTTYAERVCSFGSCLEQNSLVYPEMFRSVYSAIQRAGDQGLCVKDISRILKMQEKKFSEAVVEVLEAFGRVLKVNAYDSVRVVDSLYHSKYFLTSVAAIHKDTPLFSTKDSEAKIDEESATHNREDHKDVELQKEMRGNSSKVHKVTILNFPKAVADPSSDKQTINEAKGCQPTEASSPTRNHPEEPYELRSTDSHLCKPILPWLNGDGTTNERVYKGLVRHVLGIVMQNPGIKEDDIICHMHVLNPQSCRSLLNMMVLDKDIFARKIRQTSPSRAPTILSSLLGSNFKKAQLISREHYFANPSSTHLL